ncbi:MAG: septum formation initiator family protein [Candidatus Limimorpha sp.]
MKLKSILKKFTNKYVISTLIFVAVIVFIDQYNVFEQGKSIRKLRKMKKQEEYYDYEIQKQKDTLEMLYKDTLLMEKIAREKYMMKRDNEVIYVLEQR